MYGVKLHKRLSDLDATFQLYTDCQDDYFKSVTGYRSNRHYSYNDYQESLNYIGDNTTLLHTRFQN